MNIVQRRYYHGYKLLGQSLLDIYYISWLCFLAWSSFTEAETHHLGYPVWPITAKKRLEKQDAGRIVEL